MQRKRKVNTDFTDRLCLLHHQIKVVVVCCCCLLALKLNDSFITLMRVFSFVVTHAL